MAKSNRDALVRKFLAKNPGPPNFPRFVPRRPGQTPVPAGQWGHWTGQGGGAGGLATPGQKTQGSWKKRNPARAGFQPGYRGGLADPYKPPQAV